MSDAEEARRSLQSSRLQSLADLMKKFDEQFTLTFDKAQPQDRARLRSITARFDPYVIAAELQEWADESTKEDA